MLDLKLGTVAGKNINRSPTAKEQQWLIQQLSHRKSRMRWMAANTLGKLRVQEAIEPLIQALNDPHWLVRLHAATALGRLADPRAGLPLQQALADPCFFVRRRAVAAWSVIIDEQDLPILLRQLRKDKRFRQPVYQGLTRFMPPRVVYRLSHAVTTGERTWLRSDIASMGSFLTPILLWLLKHSRIGARQVIIPLLGSFGDERALGLLQQLAISKLTPWRFKHRVVEAIGDIETRKFEWLLENV